MLDRVTGMQVFSRVAALGSLSAAGRALGMSQTMATKHMAALEDRLGVKLLHRTTRRMSLTEAGRQYLEAVDRILGEIEEADAQASIEKVQVRGTLRLNAPVSFGIREVAPLLPIFAKAHPALTVELGLNDRHVDLIEEGWDLVIRVGSLKDSTMMARRLAPCRTVLCAAPAYIEKHGHPRSVAELEAHNCLGYTLSSTLGADRWSFGEKAEVSVAVDGTLKANNGDALVAAALRGQGIVYQPSFLVAHEIEAGHLLPIDLDHPTIEYDGIFAAYPSDRSPPAKVRAIIDFFADTWSRQPPWDRCLSGDTVDSVSE